MNVSTVAIFALLLPALILIVTANSGRNEKFTDCGPYCGGDGCSPIMYIWPCNQTCAAGVFCECGYFRNYDGDCVAPQECPRGVTNLDYPRFCPGEKCFGQSEYYAYSNLCEDQCPPTDGSPCNALWNNPGCFCLPGWKRHPRGICVPENECPSGN